MKISIPQGSSAMIVLYKHEWCLEVNNITIAENINNIHNEVVNRAWEIWYFLNYTAFYFSQVVKDYKKETFFAENDAFVLNDCESVSVKSWWMSLN